MSVLACPASVARITRKARAVETLVEGMGVFESIPALPSWSRCSPVRCTFACHDRWAGCCAASCTECYPPITPANSPPPCRGTPRIAQRRIYARITRNARNTLVRFQNPKEKVMPICQPCRMPHNGAVCEDTLASRSGLARSCFCQHKAYSSAEPGQSAVAEEVPPGPECDVPETHTDTTVVGAGEETADQRGRAAP